MRRARDFADAIRFSSRHHMLGFSTTITLCSPSSHLDLLKMAMLPRAARPAMAAINSAAPVAIAARAGFHSSSAQAAPLREVELRIKSVKNIEKITAVGILYSIAFLSPTTSYPHAHAHIPAHTPKPFHPM